MSGMINQLSDVGANRCSSRNSKWMYFHGRLFKKTLKNENKAPLTFNHQLKNTKKAKCDKQCVTRPTTKTIQTNDGPTFHELEETM